MLQVFSLLPRRVKRDAAFARAGEVPREARPSSDAARVSQGTAAHSARRHSPEGRQIMAGGVGANVTTMFHASIKLNEMPLATLNGVNALCRLSLLSLVAYKRAAGASPRRRARARRRMDRRAARASR
jgi:hypothetical protein